MSVVRDTVRATLRALEFASLKMANLRRDATSPRAGVDDLLKAKRVAAMCDEAASVLDVGCGNGHRLTEMSLFLQEQVRLVGVDVALRPPPVIAGARVPELLKFTGSELPFGDREVDVVMICYVLHHLAPDHATQLLREATRVAKHKLLLLEDTMPQWGLAYQLRNWAHLTESNLHYEEESADFSRHFGIEGFHTLDEWRALLSALPRADRVTIDPLDGIKRYDHHHLIEVTVCP